MFERTAVWVIFVCRECVCSFAVMEREPSSFAVGGAFERVRCGGGLNSAEYPEGGGFSTTVTTAIVLYLVYRVVCTCTRSVLCMVPLIAAVSCALCSRFQLSLGKGVLCSSSRALIVSLLLNLSRSPRLCHGAGQRMRCPLHTQ